MFDSIHLSDENLWLVEQVTGNIFVLCGLDWKTEAMGNYWVHVPLVTNPVMDLAVSVDNQVVLVDCCETLLSHSWSIVEGNSGSELESQMLEFSRTDEKDWELLN